MDFKKELDDFRCKVKEEICRLLKEVYLDLNGENPNFENDEEYVLENYDVADDDLFINVVVWDTCGDFSYNELQEVQKYIVTLDNNLFFICGGGNWNVENETEWSEISTDELVAIYEFILKNNGGM